MTTTWVEEEQERSWVEVPPDDDGDDDDEDDDRWEVDPEANWREDQDLIYDAVHGGVPVEPDPYREWIDDERGRDYGIYGGPVGCL